MYCTRIDLKLQNSLTNVFLKELFPNYLHSSWSSNEVEAVDRRQNLDRRIKMGEVKMF